MDERLQQISQQFLLSENLFRKALHGLSDEDLQRRPGDGSNCMLWIAGHAAYTRCLLARMLGLAVEKPWDESFTRGSAKQKDPSLYPGLQEILTIWEEVSGKLNSRFESITVSELDSPSPLKLPSPDNSILGAVGFFAFHEAYHVGQMAYLFTWLGKGQLVG